MSKTRSRRGNTVPVDGDVFMDEAGTPARVAELNLSLSHCVSSLFVPDQKKLLDELRIENEQLNRRTRRIVALMGLVCSAVDEIAL